MTVGIIAIPQGMANAMLANLPPVYGLYGGIIPVFIHSLFTGSYQLHVGPYAIGSLMCASFLSFIDYETEIEEFVSATVTLAFLSGAILVLLSFLRLGIVTRVLSDAVVTAFTASSAIQLLSSQIGGYWGVSTGTGSPLKQVIILFSPSTIYYWDHTFNSTLCWKRVEQKILSQSPASA